MKEVKQQSAKRIPWRKAITAAVIVCTCVGKTYARTEYSDVTQLEITTTVKGNAPAPKCTWEPTPVSTGGGTLGMIKVEIPSGKNEMKYDVMLFGDAVKNANGDIAMKRENKDILYPVNMTMIGNNWKKRTDTGDVPIFAKDAGGIYSDLAIRLDYSVGDIVPGLYTATINVQYSME
ncbi:hypothetical protein GQ105_005435 [Salmonella enterica]|nr:hypothetical protein [Salmonella enterica]